jgi:hypothetical protein
MRKNHFFSLAFGVLLIILGAATPEWSGSLLYAREKKPVINPNDPTLRLYTFLDTKRDGKLADFYFLADAVTDPSHPGQEWQHVILAEYDKSLFFGKFKMTVRSISKPTPDQLKAYTVKALYDFGSDSAKFAKIDPGPFGQKGDLYMVVEDDKPIASAPITPEVQATYEKYVSQYLLPALEKEND